MGSSQLLLYILRASHLKMSATTESGRASRLRPKREASSHSRACTHAQSQQRMDSRPSHNLGGRAPARTNALVEPAHSFSKGLVDLYQSVIADPMNGGVNSI